MDPVRAPGVAEVERGDRSGPGNSRPLVLGQAQPIARPCKELRIPHVGDEFVRLGIDVLNFFQQAWRDGVEKCRGPQLPWAKGGF